MLKKQLFVSFAVGFIFALGLGLSGMTQPQKVIGFLDFLGQWDPDLIFVMVGAIAFHGVAFEFIRRQKSPFFASAFQWPAKSSIDWRLIAGSSLFGIGWGLGGYCPGPGLVALMSGQSAALVFVEGLIGGMLAFRAVSALLHSFTQKS